MTKRRVYEINKDKGKGGEIRREGIKVELWGVAKKTRGPRLEFSTSEVTVVRGDKWEGKGSRGCTSSIE